MADIIFVSCGQRTPAEKTLGQEICRLIRERTMYEPYFAEFQSNLSGLNENILGALSRAVGIVTVLHARGEVSADGTRLGTRASVWVEQEIAIAAYIEQTTERKLLTAAYVQNGVELEGIRTLLHLNPTKFDREEDIVSDLAVRLSQWPGHSAIPASGLRLDTMFGNENGLPVGTIYVRFRNEGPRIKEYSCTLDIPALLLKFSNANYLIEVSSQREGYRRFRINENHRRSHIDREETFDLLNLSVALLNLGNAEREVARGMQIYASADMQDRVYKTSLPVKDIFDRLTGV